MPDNPTKEEVQAQIAASEARTETRVVRLEGKIDALAATIVGKIDTVSEKVSRDYEYNRSTRWVIAAMLLTLAVLVVGLATYGDAMFGRGMNVKDVIETTIKETMAEQQTHNAPDKK